MCYTNLRFTYVLASMLFTVWELCYERVDHGHPSRSSCDSLGFSSEHWACLGLIWQGCCPWPLFVLKDKIVVLCPGLSLEAQVLVPDLDVLRWPWHYRLILHTSRRLKSHPYSRLPISMMLTSAFILGRPLGQNYGPWSWPWPWGSSPS